MILIAGGTGTLGRELVTRLTGADQPVRVLTRDPARAAGMSAEIAIGDVRDPATLPAAMRGCAAVVSAVHGFLGGRGAGPAAIDEHGNAHLIHAAGRAGVQHFVLLSVLGARADHPMSLHRAKHAAEQHLHASNLTWTVLRPSAYLETWAGVIGAKLVTGGPGLVFGRGANPINFVSVRDVAAIAERAITDPTLHGQTIDLPGPDNLTMTQFAELLASTKIRRIPRGVLRAMSVTTAPLAPAFARQAAAAVFMDATDMAADPTPIQARFPDIGWHHAQALIGEHRHSPSHSHPIAKTASEKGDSDEADNRRYLVARPRPRRARGSRTQPQSGGSGAHRNGLRQRAR